MLAILLQKSSNHIGLRPYNGGSCRDAQWRFRCTQNPFATDSLASSAQSQLQK